MLGCASWGVGLCLSVLGAQQQGVGPDLICGHMSSIAYWGSVDGVHAYSLATIACNAGDMPVSWIAETNEHPVIAQNLYRVSGGRIVQIGMSWVKHGYAALQQEHCFPCQAYPSPEALGPGCSDPYSAATNGFQNGLGPRSEVNASTGEFVYPFGDPSGGVYDRLTKRVQVHETDMQDQSAVYIAETIYVCSDDAAWGNGFNNASYRRMTRQSNYTFNLVSSTNAESPAIAAWRDHGLGADTPDPGVVLKPVDVPGDGRIWLAGKAIDLGDGYYRYEYAVENVTSDRSGASLSVYVPTWADVRAIGFHDIDHHSGEPYSTEDWAGQRSGEFVAWSVADDYATNPDANALRWGTLFSFWFESDAAPGDGWASLGLFGPGSHAAVGATLPAPRGCAADLDGDGDADGIDVGLFLQAYGTSAPASDVNGDGLFNGLDVGVFLQAYSEGCA